MNNLQRLNQFCTENAGGVMLGLLALWLGSLLVAGIITGQ